MKWLRRPSPEDLARAEAERVVAQRRDMFNLDPVGPETTARAADGARRIGQPDEAFTLSVKAIDRLHDLYGFDHFSQRQPSSADAPLVDLVTETLADLVAANPDAEIRDRVREVTHRLRSIATSTEEIRGNAASYRAGLDELARLAPDINVDDIFWH